jgi:3-deoxy-7-phosphoheptulonate synthase
MQTRRPTELPNLAVEDDGAEPTSARFALNRPFAKKRPYLLWLAGARAGTSIKLDEPVITIGRASACAIHLADDGASRHHAQIVRIGDTCELEDTNSANGTFVNGSRITSPVVLRDGDKVVIGSTVFKFALYDELDEHYERRLREPMPQAPQGRPGWSPDSWRKKPIGQTVPYADKAALATTASALQKLPPLVLSWEIEELKALIAEAQEGRRFLLQGGDCAEMFDECQPNIIINKLKILIQMSLVVVRGARRPVIRVGRFAGQYAKPRSSPVERRDGVELPSYFGDLVNGAAFAAEARQPNPERLLAAYYHSALTLNFVRALSGGGFSDLRRPEYFDLSYFERAELPTDVRTDYARLCREVTDGLDFMQAVGDRKNELLNVKFYTSHEGLNLDYESAQTRQVPRRTGFYDLTTHMPWIGERTRELDGAHVEFFRGIANPVAVKVGPKASGDEVVALCDALNPGNEPGKLVLVTRMGAKNVTERLRPIVERVAKSGRRVLWVSDPMHGNSIVTPDGRKTRDFEDILSEIERSMDVHESAGTYLGGVHFELTGEDVTECVGGGLKHEDLSVNYSTHCDPRLNYRQAIQMAFCLARRLDRSPRAPASIPPPSLR